PRNVRAPFDWSRSNAFGGFSDNLPELDAIDEQSIQAGVNLGRQLIQNLLTNNPDRDLAFDLSIQTPETLEELILSQYEYNVSVQPSQNLLGLRDEMGQTPQGRGNEVYQLINKLAEAKDIYDTLGEVRPYRDALQQIARSCRRKLNNQAFRDDEANATAVEQYQSLLDEVQPELDQLERATQLPQPLAQAMNQSINEHCPNRASDEMQTFRINVAMGGEREFQAPSTVTLNNKIYTVTGVLGVGGLGVALKYEDDEGNAVVL